MSLLAGFLTGVTYLRILLFGASVMVCVCLCVCACRAGSPKETKCLHNARE